MRKLFLLATATTVVAGLIGTGCATAAHADVSLAVAAPRGAVKALTKWEPFAKYLQSKIGTPVKVIPESAKKLEASINDKTVDYALCNPVQAVMVHQMSGAKYLASLVTDTGKKFGGVIVANPKSGVTKGIQLKGKRVIGMAKAAAGGYLFQAYELKKDGLDVPAAFGSYRVIKNQDDAVLAVKAGLADAAFVRTGIVESLIAAGKMKKGDVVIVDAKSGFPQALSTTLYPEWYLVQSNKADPNAAKVKAAALALTPNSPAAKAAKIKGFDEPVNAGDTVTMMKAMKVPPFNK